MSAVLKKDSSKVFVDKQDRYGDTALHIASGQGHREVVKELLSQKANKDVLNQVSKPTGHHQPCWDVDLCCLAHANDGCCCLCG